MKPCFFMKSSLFIIFLLIASCAEDSDPLPPEPSVLTLAGSTAGFADGTGSAAQFAGPYAVGVDTTGNVYVGDVANRKIRKINADGNVTTLAGSTVGFADGTGSAAKFFGPNGIAVDASGNIYVGDTFNHKIRKISPAGVVTTLAGSTSGDADGTGLSAQFNEPKGVAVDISGNLYVADYRNHKIRKISPAGVVTTLAGSTEGYADGVGGAAKFKFPTGIDIDASGNVYVADTYNEKIRKITSAGLVTTLAGSTNGFQDGDGATAKFATPSDIAVDSRGNIYVADFANNRIRKIDPSGNVSTFAGSTPGFLDGPSTKALFNNPASIAIDNSDNFFIGDIGNEKVRVIRMN
jgi:sugar lactone lactonase YvrE